ncbi:Cyclin-dependent kinase 11B like protein [Argiope bruennichi]|uniref:cyclin-dependent kinase n=1 Tax=Argiope bruennichi TaxID=94029 RepID=A0A8T0E2L2_ARGBR|nr:Cyclin-dependent kinase 11B like protein [Argiope bruennichi]
MAYHDNLRTIPLTGTASESEEDGEIVKDIDMKELPTINEEDHESESSKDEGDDSLDIKPPQASIKSRDTRRDDRKKSRHSRKHDSRRRDHHRSHDRNSRREGRTWQTDPGRKDRDADNRTVRYRDDGSRSKERDYRKNMDVRDLSDIRDIREIRVKKDVRDSRDRSSDKSKDERHLHNSKGEEEEEEEEEEAAVEETSEEGEVKKEAEPEKSTSPVKEEVPTPAPEPAPYKPAIQGCRSVEEFHCLNRIEEGTYGVVYRARDKRTDEIVALKRLKMEKEKEGFPITSLREINTLLKAQHPNIVTVREIVVGSNMDKIYIVMDYVEHDLKSLMETMKQPFLVGEVKTLMLQLLCAVAHLHDNWILHRDLKTSNLLLSHKGVLKVGDFGLAREYGSPLKPYTPVVVTLWYRAPELLLGAKQYSTPIDMWSVGCIFGELLTMKPLFPGKSEIDQLNRIFKDLGTPSEKIWHGYSELPLVKKVTFTEYPYNNLRSRFGHNFTDLGFDLLNRFLTYNPSRRITAEDASKHEFFNEKPKPVSPNMFPTWPAKSEQGHRKAQSSPKPPSGGKQYARQMGEADDEGLMAAAGFHMAGAQEGHSAKGAGFSLKF